jgi:hypothetical protein
MSIEFLAGTGTFSRRSIGPDDNLMRPLLLHSSVSAAEPANRRVIHIEFAAAELPDGVQWQESL